MDSDGKPSGLLAAALLGPPRKRSATDVIDDLIRLRGEALDLWGPRKTAELFAHIAKLGKSKGRPKGTTKYPDDSLMYGIACSRAQADPRGVFKPHARAVAEEFYRERGAAVGQGVDAIVKRLTERHTADSKAKKQFIERLGRLHSFGAGLYSPVASGGFGLGSPPNGGVGLLGMPAALDAGHDNTVYFPSPSRESD